MAFHKGSVFSKPKKIAAAHGPAPDLEDAFDVRRFVDSMNCSHATQLEDEDIEEEEADAQDEVDDDVDKDNLIVQKGKAKQAAKSKTAK